MRTIKREALLLNQNKLKSLKELCKAYSKEKQYWLNNLKGWRLQAQLGNPRIIRDELVKQGYKSRYGLQARHWKLALQDAVETWDKYWKAVFAKVSPNIHTKDLKDIERRYAYWLLKGYSQFAQVMQGQIPKPPFEIDLPSCRKIAGYLQRSVRRHKGRPPTVKKHRTVKFDANCYEVFEYHDRQYIKLMSLERGKRIIIPLRGKTNIEGNLTLVVDELVYIHISNELTPSARESDTLEAVDFGYTEVMTDTEGMSYGMQLGDILTKASETRFEKMQKRHKLHSIEKKLRIKDPLKAKKIRKYNLGTKKLRNRTRKVQKTLSREINSAINELIEKKSPSILVTENLSHLFTYNKSKKINRKLSGWVRGTIQDRISFKALAEGFRHEQVNPAYGSQTCPNCDYVDQKNRNADKFKCLFCRYEDQSDRVAALNYARRYGDVEIGLYTPVAKVKTILLGRFHRRLETGQPVTVPGRTLDTVLVGNPQPSIETMCHSR